MAAVVLQCNSGECTLVASTAKTILQIKAPTNQRVLVKSLRLFGKQSANGNDPVVKVRITRSSGSFGTGTAQTAGTGTYSKNDPSDSETPQTVVTTNFTAEPTTPVDSGLWYELQPQIGILDIFAPDQFIKIPGGQSINVECTSTATPVVMAQATFEE